MATVTFFEGVNYQWRYSDFRRYEIVSETDDTITLNWDEDEAGPIDYDQAPAEIVLRISDGLITQIDCYDETDLLIVQISGISVDVDIFKAFDREDNGEFYDYIVSGGSAFVGFDSLNDELGMDIETGTGDDVVADGTANTFTKDRGGSDIYNMGGGFDTLSYDQWFFNPQYMISGITVVMNAGTVVGPDGLIDTFTGVEGFRGTFLADSFTGNAEDNRFSGLQGDDIINGKSGFDTVDYRPEIWNGGFKGVRVDLRKGTATDSFGDTDTLINIEAVQGTDWRDIIRDNGKNNHLDGRDGNDVLVMKKGNDWAVGGDGADLFKFRAAFGDDVVKDFDLAEGDRLDIKGVSTAADLTVTIDGNGTLLEIGMHSVFLEDVFVFDDSFLA